MFVKVLILALAISVPVCAQLRTRRGRGPNIRPVGTPFGRQINKRAIGSPIVSYARSLGGAVGVGAPVGLPRGNILVPQYGFDRYPADLDLVGGLPVYQSGPVNAAVLTVSRTVDYRPVPNIGEPPVIQDINVPPQESPLRINFQSKSSPLILTQQHIPAEPGQIQVTQSEDEPQTAIHNVLRPVVQRVNEVVQPYRTLTQTVEPVIEQTHTNIAQGEGVRLTGLTSGVVGGTGVIAASGLGVVAPALNVGAPYGVAKVAGLGYGLRAPAVAPTGLAIGGLSTVGLSNTGLYGGGLVRRGVTGLSTGIISQWGL